MKIVTRNELQHLSPGELRELFDIITAYLAQLPPDSVERENALASLDNIRAVLARPKRFDRLGGWTPAL